MYSFRARRRAPRGLGLVQLGCSTGAVVTGLTAGALARTVGWVAQWNEMISDPAQKIGRPRQLYTGPTQRDYVAVDKR